ncbi:NADH pyrophosphatase [Labilithrix luteola]|uniref:NAD-capped RNA hydrolase NudC n=1 Tax=Labilithrix luteola TaxID=1391654 RepID=A0A0K1PUX7_9BACT|nr:NAD(+) diphosphatase [Labilithrix luteola]AKU97333.1 NADH pyrophosphatase [Labilithrix luteola]
MAFIPSHVQTPPHSASTRRIWYVVQGSGLVVRREGERFVLPSDDDVKRLGIELTAAHHLGSLDDAHVVAAAFEGDATELGADLVLAAGLRSLASTLSPDQFWVAGRAIHVIDWATTNRFCGRCGTPTERVSGERSMRCPACGLSAYPRIAPAIIVLVRKGDEALLARNARFPGAFFSTLAGFAEIGESLEQTLAREVFEEVGVQVGNIRYFGSQPWPFPHSLMIGFTCEWTGGDIRVDGNEIAEANWFRADALPTIPPRLSIARNLIDAWVEEVTGAPAPVR